MLKDSEALAERAYVESNPHLAKMAFTTSVIIEEVPDNILEPIKKYFKPEKFWTEKNVKKIKTSSDNCGGPIVEKGKHYLFLSNTNKTPNHQVAIELAQAQLHMAKLARKTDFIGDINPAWLYCNKDNECISKQNSCGEFIALSKYHEETFSKYSEMKKDLKCKKNSTLKKLSLKCINFFCS